MSKNNSNKTMKNINNKIMNKLEFRKKKNMKILIIQKRNN